jgi:lysozyme
MPTPIVIDLSHFNTIPESLVPAQQSGIIGVIHKATQGTTYTDPDVGARWYLTKQAGMLWGLYAFLEPGDMVAQAQYFVGVAQENGDDNTLLCADYEESGISIDDLLQFLQEVQTLTGRQPVIYSGSTLKEELNGTANAEISAYRLWLAEYCAPPPSLPAGFSAYWLWQYSEDGTVPGVDSPVDVDTGDAAQVTAQWSGAPLPAPVPVSAEVTERRRQRRSRRA